MGGKIEDHIEKLERELKLLKIFSQKPEAKREYKSLIKKERTEKEEKLREEQRRQREQKEKERETLIKAELLQEKVNELARQQGIDLEDVKKRYDMNNFIYFNIFKEKFLPSVIDYERRFKEKVFSAANRKVLIECKKREGPPFKKRGYASPKELLESKNEFSDLETGKLSDWRKLFSYACEYDFSYNSFFDLSTAAVSFVVGEDNVYKYNLINSKQVSDVFYDYTLKHNLLVKLRKTIAIFNFPYGQSIYWSTVRAFLGDNLAYDIRMHAKKIFSSSLASEYQSFVSEAERNIDTY